MWADGERVAYRRRDPLSLLLGQGWPDEERLVADLRARLARAKGAAR